MRCSDLHHLGRRADAHDLSARISAFRPEIDQPVRRSDDVEIVLDDQQRVARRDQAPERTQELRDVVEVQAGGRLVEQEQLATLLERTALVIALREVTGEFQALRFAARQRRHRLPQPQIVEAHFHQRLQRREHLALAGEELRRLCDTVMSSTSAMLRPGPSPRCSVTSRISLR